MAQQGLQLTIQGNSLDGLIPDVIRVNTREVAEAFATFLTIGSRIINLSIDQLNVTANDDTIDAGTATVVNLIEHGNPVFNALLYVKLPLGNRPAVVRVPHADRKAAIPHGEIASAIFFQYFMIMTRGSPSDADDATAGTRVPKFLGTVLQLRQTPKYYHDILASFPLSAIGNDWVRYVQIGGLSTEARSRLSLGVAGYRVLAPFRYLSPHGRDTWTTEHENAYRVALQMAQLPASWDWHPATRDPNLTQRFGPLNANLNQLALMSFTGDDLANLVTTRAIFAVPVDNPTVRDWMSWTAAPTLGRNSNIFP